MPHRSALRIHVAGPWTVEEGQSCALCGLVLYVGTDYSTSVAPGRSPAEGMPEGAEVVVFSATDGTHRAVLDLAGLNLTGQPTKPCVSQRQSRADRGLSERPRTISNRRVSKAERRRLELLYPYPEGVQRPARRGDCTAGGNNSERPCCFAACAHHLAITLTDLTGAVRENFPDRDFDELLDTCALDVADRGGVTLEEVALRMNMTRERVRQLERTALSKLPRPVLRHIAESAAEPLAVAGPEIPPNLPEFAREAGLG